MRSSTWDAETAMDDTLKVAWKLVREGTRVVTPAGVHRVVLVARSGPDLDFLFDDGTRERHLDHELARVSLVRTPSQSDEHRQDYR
ncbi:MAG TPA: hypothetical protein VEP49_12920 [Acidimicrobiia bacterium]|nr:hypothetical protein [Acidimicrobiia bacterium]